MRTECDFEIIWQVLNDQIILQVLNDQIIWQALNDPIIWKRLISIYKIAMIRRWQPITKLGRLV